MLKTVLEHIAENIDSSDSCFVFPSAVAARFWAGHYIEKYMKPVDLSRFMAWDSFKAQCLSLDHKGLVCANNATRALFAASILEENAQKAQEGKPLFRELVVPDYAQDYRPFLAPVAKLLSPLDRVVKQIGSSKTQPGDPYFSDLLYIHERYDCFLKQYLLYEAAWERAPFRNSPVQWLLFIPELAEDWHEYADELKQQSSVLCIHLDQYLPGTEPVPEADLLLEEENYLVQHDTSEKEINRLALIIRKLLDRGLTSEDIVCTVADLNAYEERLRLEFSLRDIPISIRKGRNLADYPGGRIFSSLASCASGRWAYQDLKELLLDKAFAWKQEKTIQQLMDFGLQYRCVSGYAENGKEIDVWEETFNHLQTEQTDTRFPLSSLRSYYRSLKRDILAILKSGTFSALHANILMFVTNHMDRDLIHEESDRVFSRAMEELSILSETEERLSGLSIPSPFGIFLNSLKETPYVFQNENGGIPVYDYRVSAGIHPALHFLLNINQDTVSISHDKAFFLREDRKRYLGLEERDMSSDYLLAYRVSGSHVCFSFADSGFSGYGIPHIRLTQEPFKGILPASSLMLHSDEYAVEEGRSKPAEDTFSPGRVQRAGRTAAACICAPHKAPDPRFYPLDTSELLEQLKERLAGEKDILQISPSDLNQYLACPFAWLLSKGLRIQEKQSSIETIDQRDLGTLYHRILERLFIRIQEEDPRFRKEKIGTYRVFLTEELDSALEESRKTEGAFQESVYAMLKDRIYAALNDYLETDADILDGLSILGAELPLYLPYPHLNAALGGKADLVMQTNDGALLVTDFKTGFIPRSGDLVQNEEYGATNVQLAAYIRMLEEQQHKEVAYARFYSIDNRKMLNVVAPEGPARSNQQLPLPREKYEDTVLQTDLVMHQIADSIQSGSFPVPEPGQRQVCASCRVYGACRILYTGEDE